MRISPHRESMNNKEITKIFKAMGNDRRFAILKHLRQRKELTVSQIAELINLSFKSTSRHLAVLAGANLIEARQVNLNRFYSISSAAPKRFVEFLSN